MMVVLHELQVLHVQLALADLPLEIGPVVAEMEADEEGEQGQHCHCQESANVYAVVSRRDAQGPQDEDNDRDRRYHEKLLEDKAVPRS